MNDYQDLPQSTEPVQEGSSTSASASPSPSPLPPRYSPLPVASTATRGAEEQQDLLQFDIVPRSDASSFQAGYQGLQQRGFEVWLRGDVLIKPRLNEHQHYSQCTIDLLATESIDASATGGRPVVHQLHHSSLTLWTSPDLPGTSRTADASASNPPGVLPFEFSLPEHLPHCVHLPGVKIEYRLVATLHPTQDQPDQEPLTRPVLVHLTRYTPPNPIRELIPAALVGRFTDEPKEWTLASPTTIHITLAKTLYRRAEPIRIRVRIPPPDEALVDKNLRIRSVEAELIRIVKPRRSIADKGKRTTAAGDTSATTQPTLHRNATRDGWEPHTHLLYRDGDVGAAPASSASSTSNTRPPPSHDQPVDAPQPSATTVLSYSGKSCRFSMHKALVLRLLLVPPFSAPTLPHPSPDHDAPPSGLSPLSAGTSGGGGGCESVSQQTELSSVQFRVRVTVHLRGQSGSAGSTTDRHRLDAQQSVHVEQEVYVLPGLAGDVRPSANGSASSGEAGTSASANISASGHSPLSDEEEEFDGYEDFRDQDDDGDALADQVPSLSVHAPIASSSGHARPPSFEESESSRRATTEALLNMAVGNPSFTTSRRQEQGEDLPPNVEDSRNDLQIFPGQDGGEHDDGELPPPPPISPARSEHHDHAPPPPWLTHDSSSVDIEGVGTGQRRFPPPPEGLDLTHVTYDPHARTPPPEFEGQEHGSFFHATSSPPPPPTPPPTSEYTSRAAQADPPPYMHPPVAGSSTASSSNASQAGPSRLPTAAEEKEALAAAFANDDEQDEEGDTSRTPTLQPARTAPLSAQGLGLLPPAYGVGEARAAETGEGVSAADEHAGENTLPPPPRRAPVEDDELPVYQE